MAQSLIAGLERRVAYHREQLRKFEDALEAAKRDEEERLNPQKLLKAKSASAKRQDNAVTKIDFIYNLIEKHGNKGITTADITQLANAASVTGGANFPYVILWKLKKEGSVRSEDGRYYPIKKKPMT